MAFDKLKQLNDIRKMRSQAQAMQKELEKIKETVEKDGVQVTVTGDQKVVSLKVDDEEREEIVDAINDAMKKVQKRASKKMMEMGGGLSGLLGG